MYQRQDVIGNGHVIGLIVDRTEKAQDLRGNAARHAIHVDSEFVLEGSKGVLRLLVELSADKGCLQEPEADEALLELSDVGTFLTFEEDLALAKLVRVP